MVMGIKKVGALLVILGMLFCIATQDNPYIKDQIKPKPKSTRLRVNDLTRHISVIGACLFLMFTGPKRSD